MRKTILFVLTIAAAVGLGFLPIAAQESNIYKPPVVEKVKPNATQISGRVSNALFSPSGEWMILQTDCGFFVLPVARLDEALDDLEKTPPREGEAKGFLPSGKIVYWTMRGLFTLDPSTRETDAVYQPTETDAETGKKFYDRTTFVVSENLIVADDGSYEKDLQKGNILRFDLQKQSAARGAQVDAFKEGSLSPSGRYVFYKYLESPNNFAGIYDVRRDVNYRAMKLFNINRRFPNLRIYNFSLLNWVAADKFVARIDAYKRNDYNMMPTWFVMFDAITGRIIWKQEQDSDAEVTLQPISPTKALLEKSKELYELSLINGKLTKIPELDGTTFAVSANKKNLAYLNDGRIFTSATNGANKKSVLDLPEDWRGRLLYDGQGISRIVWPPDGKRLIVFGDTRLLIVRL